MGGEAGHVLSANQRNMLPETPAKQLGERAAMLLLFGLHLFEDFGGRGVIFAETVGDVAVNAAVFFLVADRQGENFHVAQVGKSLGHWGTLSWKGELIANAAFSAFSGRRGRR